ncbi:hypothetical protein HYV83_02480 [Candidatus Woesearchaeota archaeon]|nr:hypothetical protein [Candidatus Woesearchaeota archaeon]
MAVEAVLDANVLFRMLISQGDILEILFDDELRLCAPERLKEEFLKHKEDIAEKSKLPLQDLEKLTSLILSRVSLVAINEYKASLPRAKELLGTHEKDEDFVALCLIKDIKVWTYEKLLFKIGVGISTKQLGEKLSSTVRPAGKDTEKNL